jgi:hypothetical protein
MSERSSRGRRRGRRACRMLRVRARVRARGPQEERGILASISPSDGILWAMY